MGSNSKWIDSHPNDSSRQVARRALASRLRRMWRYLRLAVERPCGETENIHQLRVFSRRAAAAMEIFEGSMPRRRGRWMRKQVKRVRKASGEARDLDVLLMRYAERLRRMPSGETALVLEEIKRRRTAAQQPVAAIHDKLAQRRFGPRISKLIARVHSAASTEACGHEFACMARIALARLARPYLEAGEANLAGAEALHAFRIQGKQVRYAMEIFAGAFDDDFRQQVYPLVADLQDRLGTVNDHVTARTYFAAWHTETDSCSLRRALETALELEQRAFDESRQDFLSWWTRDRSSDLRLRFARYVQLAAEG
jgi:CHAD domain-containing protein